MAECIHKQGNPLNYYGNRSMRFLKLTVYFQGPYTLLKYQRKVPVHNQYYGQAESPE